ncbi:ParB/RepB/Spo0J family partition protein [Acetobacter oeni]|uniref:Chromosome partitioning protein ParB n=1 Tax=Acetobacter oeni TaxID=304077 RepID=A0A511XLV5_9PROT|nr:ParB/RepB/Spo0J family partition protein [Acetobacter oeni]MBB3882948.1 ParB family chromosome partitioning protein [Acetobacter oeni]NHO19030.1 ParB/RepB/Spo0J family partition protein [Acetobacter oeni]GEN63930.1 chromosome partitioning protein ParB [Acetobacter oeni]
MSTNKTPPRPRLGRGLAALLGDQPPAAAAPRGQGSAGGSISSLPIESLEPSPFQPRQIMEPEALSELAESIRARGVLQPLLARPHPEKPGVYQIIGGERRWRASQQAGLHEIPVLVRDLDDSDAMAAALVENLQRADLNPMEEAEGFSRLIEDYRLTQDELARAIGKSRPHITNTLRLLRLPPALRQDVTQGKLSAGHARALLGHPDPVAAAREVIARDLSVRQTEALVQKANKVPAADPAKPARERRDPEIAMLERDLSARLGLQVQVQFDGKGGSIRFSYRTLDQLDSLLALLNR